MQTPRSSTTEWLLALLVLALLLIGSIWWLANLIKRFFDKFESAW